MNGKMKLDLEIQKIEKTIKGLTEQAKQVKESTTLENEEFETKLRDIKNISDTYEKQLKDLKELSDIYEEAKNKIKRLQFLEELNYKTPDTKKEIEQLKEEIEELKGKLDLDLVTALEEETTLSPKLLEPPKTKIGRLGEDLPEESKKKDEEESKKKEEEAKKKAEEAKKKEEEESKKKADDGDKKEEKPVAESTPSFEAHVSSYEALIDDQIKKLQYRINKISKRNNWTISGDVRDSAKIKTLQKQIDLLKAEKERIHKVGFKTDSVLLGITDAEMKNKDEKISKIREEIAQLEKTKANLKNKLLIKRVENKIKRKKAIIKNIESKKMSIVGRQKTYLLPKVYAKLLANQSLANLTGQQEAYEETVNDMKELSKSTSGMFGNIKKSYYESLEKHYQKKNERTKQLLKKLNEKNGAVVKKGSTTKVVPIKAKQALSQNLQKQTQSTNAKQATMAA